MAINTRIKELDARHKADIDKLAACPDFRSETRARAYIEQKLAPIWRPLLDIDCDDEPMVDALKFTPTMVLLVRFFAHGVHRHGAQRSKLPVIAHWMPEVEADGTFRFPRQVCKRDICRVIGRSQSAVEDAIGRLRGRGDYERITSKRLACSMFGKRGIMLDVCVNLNSEFSFMNEDYDYAQRVALESRINDAHTVTVQIEHCRAAKRAIKGIPSAVSKDAVIQEAGGMQ